MIGKTISHYKILEKLGEGGMGVVYKAEDTRLHRAVALKLLAPELTRDPEARKRFLHEAQAASALDHPNICTVYEADEYEGETFIAMALLEGQSLKERIASGPLRLDEATDIAIQIAEGLQEAKEKGVIHRDIKPANVMVTAKGRAKIMDFGLAKVAGRTKLTRTGMTMGTAAYMSPEQARGEEADHRSDIWSLGIVLYEMISGRLPFGADYEQALVYSIVNEPPEPLTGLRTRVPMDLERIVNKALAKSPEERYQGAAEMLVDLKLVRKRLESGAMRPKPIQRGISTRKRALLYGGVVAALALVVFGRSHIFPVDNEPIDSIAVLPLHNLSGDPEQEYFVDGMTEALITELSKVGALRVISRTSVMRYRETDKPLPQIARELNVDAVVEGSVLRAGERVRITAQLIGATPERHLWADNYDRDLGDILILSSEVAQTIAREIKATLTPEERERLVSAGPVNPEAYELFLKGRHHFDKWTIDGFKKAIECFQGAIDIDSTYAQAYYGLADGYLWLRFVGELTPEEALSRANPPLRKALEIDGDLAEAHGTLAGIKHYFDWDFAEAEVEYKRALALNPSLVDAHVEYAFLLTAMGRSAEAIAEGRRAVQVDPLSAPAIRSLASAYLNARQYDPAIAQYRQLAELEPADPSAYSGLERVYLSIGRYDDAVKSRQKAMTVRGARPEEVEALGRAYSEGGPRGYWMWRLERLKGKYDSNPTLTAIVHVALGDKDQALVWLERAYEKRDPSLFTLKVSPEWDPLRDDLRFQSLLRRMNFPE